MFIDISIYKIIEDHLVTVSQTKNRLKVVGFGDLSLGGSFEHLFFCIFPHLAALIKTDETSLNKEKTHI